MKKNLFVVLMVIAILACAFTVVSAQDREVLKVGLTLGVPASADYKDGDPSKGVTGFDVETMRAITDCMGYDVEFIETQWSSIFTGLQSGKWDISSAQIFMRKDRAEMVDFADPYMDSDLLFITQIDKKLEKKEDLKGKKICCVTGAGSSVWLEDPEHQAAYGPYEIVTYEDKLDIWQDVLAGRCDAGIGDSPEVLNVAKKYDDKLSADLFLGMGYKCAFAFRKGDERVAAFNECQRKLKADGTIPALFEEWYGKPAPADTATNTLYDDGPYVIPN